MGRQDHVAHVLQRRDQGQDLGQPQIERGLVAVMAIGDEEPGPAQPRRDPPHRVGVRDPPKLMALSSVLAVDDRLGDRACRGSDPFELVGDLGAVLVEQEDRRGLGFGGLEKPEPVRPRRSQGQFVAEDLAALVRDRLHPHEAAQALTGAAAARRPEGVPVNVERGLLVLDQDPFLQPGPEMVAGSRVAVALTWDIVLEVPSQFEPDDILHRPAVQVQLQLRADDVVGGSQDHFELDHGRLVADAPEGGDLSHRAALELD